MKLLYSPTSKIIKLLETVIYKNLTMMAMHNKRYPRIQQKIQVRKEERTQQKNHKQIKTLLNQLRILPILQHTKKEI